MRSFCHAVSVPSAVSAGHGDGPEPGSEALAARVAAGPGLWDDEDWLAELRRDGLIGDLLAAGVIGQAAAEGGHGCRLERALTAEMTLRRHRRPAAEQAGQETNLRKNHRRTLEMANEEATYDLTIVPSNLPKADTSPET